MLPIMLLLTDKAVSRREVKHAYVHDAQQICAPAGLSSS
jgi:hypothetical protein